MNKPRILVVDDEPGVTRLMKLSFPQYEILGVNRPMEALEQARQFKPDLILLDLVMPGLDGGEVAELLKADPELSTVPIVFLTSLVSQTNLEAAESVGGYPFVAKPASRETLSKCFEKYLKR